MKDGGWGRIVNFGSGSLFQGAAGQSPTPRPWDVTAGPAGCGSARRDVGRTSLPGASAPGPGVTRSDAGGQGERTRTRRYGRQADLLLDLIHRDRTRRSARGLHSRLASDSACSLSACSCPAPDTHAYDHDQWRSASQAVSLVLTGWARAAQIILFWRLVPIAESHAGRFTVSEIERF